VNLGGGGGTDMGVGIEAAVLLRPRPGVIIVLTDGYTPWPAVPPAGIEVIVVLTRPDAASYAPAWARVLVLPEHR
jgi:predicted metal-dependent peptidase